MAWSFFVPVFFIATGMAVDIGAVAADPGLLVTFVMMILLVRGGLVWLRERFTPTGSGLATGTERLQLALYTAAGLPIIVAVTEIAVAGDLMPEGVASVLIAAGIITVLLFPLLARLMPSGPGQVPTAAPLPEPGQPMDRRGRTDQVSPAGGQSSWLLLAPPGSSWLCGRWLCGRPVTAPT